MAFYIHIPFCKKICFYCGCNACTLGKAELLVPYLEALKREISEVTPLLDKNRKLTQIHYGGGTPNAIPARYIGEINELLFSAFDFTDNPEIAIECHPAYLDDDYINDLARYGFNRFSLGIQDLDNKVLEMVNREAPREPLPDLINKIKSAGKAMSVNLDFIYGLPGQHVDGFSRTISQAIEMKPDRLVTFSYAHVPWLKKHQNILEKRGLPGPKEKIDIFLAAWELLLSSGYHSIGLDHYVRKEDELYTALRHNKLHRNFQGYCTRSTTGQVYAFGASSITQLEKGYIQNVKGVKEYIQQLKETGSAAVKGLELTPNQVIVREAITDLMCNKKVQWENTAARINISAEELLQVIELDQEALNEFEADGLMKMDANGIKLTESGSLFIRNIAASLDPAFRSETQNYSKSV
jgi:oxygen-independent coproporphyrinogen-3 oxidase